MFVCTITRRMVVMQFGEWHGRPAREITRKMRVPRSNCITTRRMVELQFEGPMSH
jgi:hypothetical protein